MSMVRTHSTVHATRVILFSSLLILVLLPMVASAQAPAAPPAQPPPPAQTAPVVLENPIRINDPRDLIGRVIGAALGVVGSIALLIFFFGGVMWMTSAGNPERVSKGKMTILWAAIGLAVIFTSYALVRFVLGALAEPSTGVRGTGTSAPGTGAGVPGR